MTQWPLAARSFVDAVTTIAPVMNPVGCALLYPQLSADLTRAERSDLARRIAVNAGLGLMIAMWAGAGLLSVLGIGMGELRIAAAWWSRRRPGACSQRRRSTLLHMGRRRQPLPLCR